MSHLLSVNSIVYVRIGILNVSISQITQLRHLDTMNVPKVTQSVNNLGFQFSPSDSRMYILTQRSSHCYVMLPHYHAGTIVWFPFTVIVTPIGVIRTFPQRNNIKIKNSCLYFKLIALPVSWMYSAEYIRSLCWLFTGTSAFQVSLPLVILLNVRFLHVFKLRKKRYQKPIIPFYTPKNFNRKAVSYKK